MPIPRFNSWTYFAELDRAEEAARRREAQRVEHELARYTLASAWDAAQLLSLQRPLNSEPLPHERNEDMASRKKQKVTDAEALRREFDERRANEAGYSLRDEVNAAYAATYMMRPNRRLYEAELRRRDAEYSLAIVMNKLIDKLRKWEYVPSPWVEALERHLPDAPLNFRLADTLTQLERFRGILNLEGTYPTQEDWQCIGTASGKHAYFWFNWRNDATNWSHYDIAVRTVTQHITAYSHPIGRELRETFGGRFDNTVLYSSAFSEFADCVAKAMLAFGLCPECAMRGKEHGEDTPAHTVCANCQTVGDNFCELCDDVGHEYRTEAPHGFEYVTCRNCRSCSTCAGCDEHVNNACRTCERCPGCCECLECSDCGARLDEYCTRCGGESPDVLPSGHHRCSGCCLCSRAPPLGRRELPLQKYLAPHVNRKTKLKRLMGAEIEIAKTGREVLQVKQAFDKWGTSIVSDGSLPSTGSEVVTQPAGGDNWVDMITEICDGLKVAKAEVSRQCGLHIHVDATDMNIWDMRRLIKLYGACEDALYSVIHPKRGARPVDDSGNYSIKCGEEYLAMISQTGKWSKSTALKAQYADTTQALESNPYLMDSKGRKVNKGTKQYDSLVLREVKRKTQGKYHHTRYKGLNLHSYWLRGTVEFRHHHGTVDAEKILNWSTICGSIVEWAHAHSDAELKTLIGDPPKVLTGDASFTVLSKVIEGSGRPGLLDWMQARRTLFATMSWRGENHGEV